MRLYFDVGFGHFVKAPGYKVALRNLVFKRGDSTEIRLGFYEGSHQISVGSTALLQFALKESGKYDSDPVVFSDNWSFVDQSTPEYFCNPSFNTTQLNDLLNHADGNFDNDVGSVDLMFEITWSLDGGVTWTSTDTLSARVYNDVIKGTEGVPGSANPPYPLSSQVFNLTDNITLSQPINLDNAQLTEEKGQADGYASLDSFGKVPASELPSYVDDVLEYADQGDFPPTGEQGKIYLALDSGKIYRWSGSVYVEISPGVVPPVDSVNGQTGAVMLDADDISDDSTTHKFATQADIDKANSALQSGDNISELNNDAGYLTSALQASDVGVSLQAHNPVLDTTTASFTVEDESKLDGLGVEYQDLGDIAAKTLPDSHTVDVSNGNIIHGYLVANTVLTLTGAIAGQSGLIILGNGSAHDGVGYIVSFKELSQGAHSPSESHSIMVGDLADFSTAPATGEYNFGTIGWFYTGDEYLLYVSEVKPYTDVYTIPA